MRKVYMQDQANDMSSDQFLADCKQTLDGCFEILKKKNHDYANTNPFSNFENVEDLDMVPEQAMLYMVKLKLNRITNLLISQKEPSNESIADSISDMVNYLVIIKAYVSRA